MGEDVRERRRQTDGGGGGQTYIVASLAICSLEKICMPRKAINLKYTVIVPFWDRRHTNAYCMCL